MLQTSFFKDWRKEVGTKQVAYREAAEHCAAIAAMNFEEQKFLAALDFSKAFDKMDPAMCYSARGSRTPLATCFSRNGTDRRATSGLTGKSVQKC